MTKIYLDTCSIQRPLDTLNQTRLRLEAEAVLGVLAQVKAGNVELVSSTVLELETQRKNECRIPVGVNRGDRRMIADTQPLRRIQNLNYPRRTNKSSCTFVCLRG